MSEEQMKNTRLLAYWLVGTVVIVFGAITAFIISVTAGYVSLWVAIKVGFPIWGITALAAAVIFAGYYVYVRTRSK